MRISDWSSDVCSSDLIPLVIRSVHEALAGLGASEAPEVKQEPAVSIRASVKPDYIVCLEDGKKLKMLRRHLMTAYNMTPDEYRAKWNLPKRSEEHTSELQSLMRISYAVFCLKKKKVHNIHQQKRL